MIRRMATLLVVVGAGLAGVAALGHRGIESGRRVPGGILIANPGGYDAWSHRLLMGTLFRPIAADIAAATPAGGRVLEVGSGPGHLALRLSSEHHLDVTGLDLDPAMIERATSNAETVDRGRRPTFVVGDVASLPFPDRSFDLVVSTLSMHHWADRAAGLSEIGRVLKSGGRALVWDFRRGWIPFHRHMPDPLLQAHVPGLEMRTASGWRWPWRLRLLQRVEFERVVEPVSDADRSSTADRPHRTATAGPAASRVRTSESPSATG